MSGVWDPLRPELDAEPPLDPPLPDVTYAVCSTPRSGSGRLCRGLAETGLAGIPAEYFNVNQRSPLARPDRHPRGGFRLRERLPGDQDGVT